MYFDLILYSRMNCCAVLHHSSSCKLLAVPCSIAMSTSIFVRSFVVINKNFFEGLFIIYVLEEKQRKEIPDREGGFISFMKPLLECHSCDFLVPMCYH